MLNLVKVISTRIVDGKSRFVKFLRYGKSDIQESVEAVAFGIDSNAPEDIIAVYAPTGEKGKTVIIGYLNVLQEAEPGEFRNYSVDAAGALAFYTWLKADGTMEIGGNVDNMVRYSALETAFNQLKTDFDALVNTYNAHTHITTATVGATPTPGVIAPTTSTGAPTSADISPAKIEEIKTI